MKVVSEGTLVAKAEVACDFSNLSAFFLQHFTGSLDAQLHDECLRTGAEGFDKFAVQLPGRKMHEAREFGDGDTGAEVGADVSERAVDLLMRLEYLVSASKAAHAAHDADGAAFAIKEGELVGDEPPWDALVGEEELNDVQLRLATGENFFIIASEVFGEPCREEIEVVFAHNVFFLGDAEAIHEATTGAHEAELAVFGKEGEVGKVVKEPIEWAARADAADETLAQRGRGIHA